MTTLIPRAVSALKRVFSSKSTLTFFTKQVEAVIPPAEPLPTFWDVIGKYNKQHIADEGLKGPTVEKRQFMLNNILAFLIEKGYRDLRIDQVRLDHAEELRQYLHEHIKLPNGKPISSDHSVRHLRICLKACGYAVKKKYISSNPVTEVERKKSKPKPIVTCSPSDILKFEGYYDKWKPQRNMICHYFLYQCFTGISYMDIWRHQIVAEQYRDVKGKVKTRLMVSCQSGRGKNGRMYWAPFLRKAQEIRELYKDGFPHVSLQTYNSTIKKIAREIGVDLHLTTHIGRKTFATVLRIQGMSMPAIAVALGNTEEVCRTRYVDGNKEMILNELDRLDVA